MATYLLTAGDDTFTGTSSDDVFDGYNAGTSGGIDTLNGGAGNDLFQIGWINGNIDGGSGIDRIEYFDHSLGNTTYTQVEILSLNFFISSLGIMGSISQFGSFASIEYSDENLMVRLTGAGGLLDFSTRVGAGKSVEVDGNLLRGGFTIIGTFSADTLLGGRHADTLNGGAGDDIISGWAGADILNGDDGNDEIYAEGRDIVDGGGGNDAIHLVGFKGSASGGAGNDTFHLEGLMGRPVNANVDGGAGKDTLLAGSFNGDLGSGTYSNIETLTADTGVRGTIAQFSSFERFEHVPSDMPFYFGLRGAGGVLDLSTRLASGHSAYVYDAGMSSGYTITGGASDDTLKGSRYADILNGGGGDDYIDGYGGGNVLHGDGGNDEIYAQRSDVADGGEGQDTIYLDNFEGSASGGAGHDTLILHYPGNDPFDIDGGTGNDRLIAYGDLGKGTFSNIEALEMFSNSIELSIAQLHAFERVDSPGPYVPYAQLTFGLRGAGDVLDLSERLGAGLKGVHVYDAGMSAGYSVTGTANNDELDGSRYADVLNGGVGNDRLRGEGGNDALFGGSGADRLFAGAGNDLLDGGGGSDAMTGELGNDTFHVDIMTDVVIEEVGGGVADRVVASASYQLTAGAEIEFLETNSVDGTKGMNLTGNEFAQTLIGNDGNNVLDGMGGADTLRGRIGNDTYVVDNSSDIIIEASGQGTDKVVASVSYALSANVSIEQMQASDAEATIALNLTGNKVAQTLIGNNGNNVLDGMGGGDTLRGRLGNDTYVVDNAGDIIIEAAGQGTDKVVTSGSYTLSANVSIEQMQTGDAESTKTLNLTGNKYAQTLIGNAGNNVLDGMGGADTLRGRAGNDTYIVDRAGDVVVEGTGQGTDKVIASVSYELSANAEIEQMQTSDAALTTSIDLTGSNTAQAIFGNAGENRLDGKGGADTLRGFGGPDTYVFSTKVTAANVDTIVGFKVADDTIELDSDIFTGLNEEAFISENQFVASTSGVATTADHRIIYETDTGNLYFDANGSGGGGRLLFAVVSTNLALTNDDFFVG